MRRSAPVSVLSVARGDTRCAIRVICAPAAYSGAAVSIESPTEGETVHDNRGSVLVELALQSLHDRTRVVLDGKPRESLQRTSSFTLCGVRRGERTLQVQLLDSRGELAGRSGPVRFSCGIPTQQ